MGMLTMWPRLGFILPVLRDLLPDRSFMSMADWDFNEFLRKGSMKYIFVLLMFTSAASYGQTIGQGANEMQIWTSEGYSVSGGRGDTGIWNAGLRYGWVLT